jgi:hypothetical protein
VSPSKGAASQCPAADNRTGGASKKNTHRQSDLSLRKQLILLLNLGVLTTKPLHASGCVDQLLFAGEERMALGTDFHVDGFAGGAGGETGPARTGNHQLVVLRVNFRFQFNIPRLLDFAINFVLPTIGNRR